MDPLWLAIAFALGFAARRIGLPPLVGYLIAGFVLHALGAESGGLIDEVAEVGVLLMLFSIGLKLQLRTLARPVVWASASLHMLVTVVVLGGVVFGLAAVGLSSFSGLSLAQAVLIAFALSFSSTVFAVKVLEDKGEVSSQHGKTAIGVLIIQDIVAIVFMTVSKGEIPSIWAIPLVIGLVVVRPLLGRLMDRSGHGELLILFGLVLTLAGAASFEFVGLKPDLGALVVGILLAQYARAPELAKTLLNVKDLLLVGFFLSVGLTGSPSPTSVAVAALLCLAIPLKSALFFQLMCRFKLRSRNAFLASLSLTNYSEFGLIVAAVGFRTGWLSADWLIILAIAVAITFVAASPLNARSHTLFVRYRDRLSRFESDTRLPEDELIDPEGVAVIVVGMGHLGRHAFDTIRAELGKAVIGMERDPERVSALRQEDYNLFMGDSTDPDLYERINQRGKVRMILLAFDNFQEKLETVKLIKRQGFPGQIAVLARHEDEIEDLKAAGADAAFNLSDEAGVGFARHALAKMEAPPVD